MNQGDRRELIFHVDADLRTFLETLAEACLGTRLGNGRRCGGAAVSAKSVFGKWFAGSTGDPPVPSGDLPDGTGATVRANGHGLFAKLPAAVPVGGSPTGAGGSPILFGCVVAANSGIGENSGWREKQAERRAVVLEGGSSSRQSCALESGCAHNSCNRLLGFFASQSGFLFLQPCFQVLQRGHA